MARRRARYSTTVKRLAYMILPLWLGLSVGLSMFVRSPLAVWMSPVLAVVVGAVAGAAVKSAKALEDESRSDEVLSRVLRLVSREVAMFLRQPMYGRREDWTMLAGRMSSRLVSLAGLVGGRRRAWRTAEFRAFLVPLDGGGPSGWRQIRYGAGFVRAALVMRLRDLGRMLLWSLDWMLAKPRAERLAAFGAVMTAWYLFVTSGLAGLVGGLDNVLAAFGLCYGSGRYLRQSRGVPPAQPRPGHSRSDD